MSCTIIVGLQWGDEGKGKIIHLLGDYADAVIRFGSGDRPGHTIFYNNVKYKLHMIPVGVFYPDKIGVLGNGMVIEPARLIEEMDYLKKAGIKLDNLKISHLAHLIFPYHKILEQLDSEDENKSSVQKAWKGISAAYTDKICRKGIRMIDLIDEKSFKEKLKAALEEKNKIFSKVYSIASKGFDVIYNDYIQYRDAILPYITDTTLLLNNMISRGKKLLFEGVQGTFMDLDFGTYPYVGTYYAIAGAASIGTGVGPNKFREIIGVTKAYTTRVGDGPFPTELLDDMGEEIRAAGGEYGTSTGKPRRCGWVDLPMLRYASIINGLTGIAVTKLDVLDGFEKIKICVGYEYKGEIYKDFSFDNAFLQKCKPVYKEFRGWQKDTIHIKNYEDLPVEAKDYLEFIACETGVDICMISTGQQKEQTIIRRKIW